MSGFEGSSVRRFEGEGEVSHRPSASCFATETGVLGGLSSVRERPSRSISLRVRNRASQVAARGPAQRRWVLRIAYRVSLVAFVLLVPGVVLAAGPARRTVEKVTAKKQIENKEVVIETVKVTLENDFLAAVILGEKGGGVQTIVLKPGGVVLSGDPAFYESEVRPYGSLGSLQDVAFVPAGDLQGAEGDEVVATLTALCKPTGFSPDSCGVKKRLPMPYVEIPDASKVQIAKRYSLRRDEAALRVEYAFTNTGAEPVAWTFSVDCSFQSANQPVRWFLPSRSGPISFTIPGGPVRAYNYDIPDAWVAQLLPDGRGLVTQFEIANTSCIYATSDGKKARGGLISTTVPIEPGGTVKTVAKMAVVRDLKAVSFAAEGLVGQWQFKPPEAAKKAGVSEDGVPLAPPAYEPEEEEIVGQLSLVSSTTDEVDVALTRRLNRTAKSFPVEQKRASVKAGELSSLPISLKIKEAGTWVLRAEIKSRGLPLASGEFPLDVGYRTGFFLPRSEAKKQGELYTDYKYSEVESKPPPHEIQSDWEPKPEYISPHVEYAKPYVKGPIRVLFICPFETTRGPIEIWERADIEYDCATIALHGYGKYHKFYSVGEDHAPVDEVDRVKDLLNKPHDVIVLGSYLWGWFPPEVQDEIVRQFIDGTGIVISAPINLMGIFKDYEAKAQPSKDFFPGDYCKVAVLQSETEEEGGRVAYTPIEAGQVLRPESWIGPVEEGVERLIRALVWAARKEPDILIEPTGLPAKGFQDELAGQEVKVKLTNKAKASFEGTLKLAARLDVVRRYPGIYGSHGALDFTLRPFESWETIAELSVPAKLEAEGSTELGLELPHLRDGIYSLDFSLLDRQGRVASWYRQPLTVLSHVEVTDVWLSKQGWKPFHALRDNLLAKGKVGSYPMPEIPLRATDTLTVRAALAKAKDWKTDRLSVSMIATDRSGRLFAPGRKELVLDGETTEVTFDLPLRHALHLMNVLEIAVEDKGRVLSEARVALPIHARPDRTSEYRLRVYDFGERQPDRTGVDVRCGTMWAGGCFDHAWIDQGMECWGDWLDRASEITPEFVRIPCLTNPDYRENRRASIRACFAESIAFVPPRAVLCDEWAYCLTVEPGDAPRALSQCRCRYCLERFQRFLRVRYWTLDRLNATWGTNFKSWSEATPPIFDETGLQWITEARLPQVLDHRCFIDEQVGEFIRIMDDTVKELDPACAVGISGNEPITPWNNLDIWQLAKNGKHDTIYRYPSIWESFGVSVIQWVGYGNKYSPSKEHSRAWTMFLDGRGVSYYGKENTPSWLPDFGILAGPTALFDAVNTIKNGPAQLLWGHKARDPVALVYHSRSIYADMMERYIRAGKAAGPKVRESASFALNAGSSCEALLNRSLVQPYWISYEELGKGKWQGKDEVKLIFLPYTISLTTEEVATIEQLVRDGATVVGDVNTATRDGHGARLKVGSLDAVFGIRHEGDHAYPILRSDPKDTTTQVRFELDGVKPFALSFAAVAPPNVVPTTAKPYASYAVAGKKCPAVLVNSYGKGKAILLNFIPSEYFVVLGSDQGAEILQEVEAKAEAAQNCELLMAWIMKQAGIVPPVSTLVNGKPGSPCSFRRFSDGRLSYLGFCGPHSLTPKQYEQHHETATLDKEYHLYNILEGRYLGFAKQIELQYKVLDLARLYACLPYKVEKLTVKLDKPAWAAGEMATFSAELSASEPLNEADRHVFRVEVTDPAGKYRKLYRYFPIARAGKARCEVPLAINDPAGTWRLVVTDVATGVKAETEFEVKQPAPKAL